MKTQEKIYLISILLLLTMPSVLSAGIGTKVTDANDCDTGFARFISYDNESGGDLYCVGSSSATQWAHPINTIQNTSHVTYANPISEGAIEV